MSEYMNSQLGVSESKYTLQECAETLNSYIFLLSLVFQESSFCKDIIIKDSSVKIDMAGMVKELLIVIFFIEFFPFIFFLGCYTTTDRISVEPCQRERLSDCRA